MDIKSFYNGWNFDIYEYLGVHRMGNGFMFRVYAPNAKSVSLMGDFNGWTEYRMMRVCDHRFFECFVDNARPGMKYLFRIYDKNGNYSEHCDPYGYGMELRPGHNSIIRDLDEYRFNDREWMENRTIRMNEPLNVYEVHLGSWNTKDNGGFLNYSEIADRLIPYCKDTGYNYIELMPIAEHPLDNSWGYLCSGFYSPTSRYGTAAQLMELVDKCHQNGIGVILDFVPVHFTADDYGLRLFDGTPLYEYPHKDIALSEWGSYNFNHAKGETASFLMSNASYWLKMYHFDGLRMDAISRIIYWQGNSNRGANHKGLNFIKTMNHGLKERFPTCMLIAEDSSSFIKVTAPVDYDGLGFDYKWDMGFMNDTLDYFRCDPLFRGGNYHSLTFSMLYFYSENFMLAFSHDENVHGKATIMQKMHGQYEDKFPQARALYMYMYTHPGKKLNFMGNEFGQLREWDEAREQDWDMLKYPSHDSFFSYMKQLNHIYLTHPALYERDFAEDGFCWIECNAATDCIYAYERISDNERLIAVFNFSGIDKSFSIDRYAGMNAEILLNTDWEEFGGNQERSTKIDLNDFNLSRFSGIIIRI